MYKNTMTRDEMIAFLDEDENIKISHNTFDLDEYIYQQGGIIYDENGYLFED